MESYNASLAPPNGASISDHTTDGLIARSLAGVSAWSIVLTALAVLIVYDQSTSPSLDVTGWSCQSYRYNDFEG